MVHPEVLDVFEQRVAALLPPTDLVRAGAACRGLRAACAPEMRRQREAVSRIERAWEMHTWRPARVLREACGVLRSLMHAPQHAHAAIERAIHGLGWECAGRRGIDVHLTKSLPDFGIEVFICADFTGSINPLGEVGACVVVSVPKHMITLDYVGGTWHTWRSYQKNPPSSATAHLASLLDLL
jgi:hypothetical protein